MNEKTPDTPAKTTSMFETVERYIQSSTFNAGIPTDDDYINALLLSDQLLKEKSPCMIKQKFLMVIIETYEAHAARFSEYGRKSKTKTPELAMLKKIVDHFFLKDDEIPEIGSSMLVRLILDGKRPLNLNQIKALSVRFRIPLCQFFDESEHALQLT